MNILLTGAFNYSSQHLKEIENLGYKIIHVQEERKTLKIDVSIFDVVVCNSLFVYNDIKSFKNLKMIHLTSAGLDRVPLEYIKENNITLFNAKGVYSIPIAEWTILKILEVYKKSKTFSRQQTNKEWKKQRGLEELTNKKVGILGYGDIGNEIAKRLTAFDAKIYAFDIFEPNTNYHYQYNHINKIQKNLNKLDIIILSLPLTKETLKLVNKDFLNKMKSDALFVNISRGKIVVEKDLIKHLKENNRFNAILDVFEKEPLSQNSNLWDLDNVIITPHNSYESQLNSERLFNKILINLKRFSDEK